MNPGRGSVLGPFFCPDHRRSCGWIRGGRHVHHAVAGMDESLAPAEGDARYARITPGSMDGRRSWSMIALELSGSLHTDSMQGFGKIIGRRGEDSIEKFAENTQKSMFAC